MSENILEINNLSKYFGGLAAVSDCSLKVKKGTITGIIGPNGSGKTTLFNLIAGNLKCSAGSVMFNNENITDVPAYELFSKGLLRTFQIAHEFTNLSVLENLSKSKAWEIGINTAPNPPCNRRKKTIINRLEERPQKTEEIIKPTDPANST